MIALLLVVNGFILAKNCASYNESSQGKIEKGNCHYTLGCLVRESSCVECKSVTEVHLCKQTCAWRAGKCGAETCSGIGKRMSEAAEGSYFGQECKVIGCTYNKKKHGCGIPIFAVVIIVVVVVVYVVVMIVIIVVYIVVRKGKMRTNPTGNTVQPADLPQGGFPPQYSLQQGFLQQGFSPQQGYAPQGGFPPQQYLPQQNFIPQQGHFPQTNYQLQQAPPPQQTLIPQQALPPQQTLIPQQAPPSQQTLIPQQVPPPEQTPPYQQTPLPSSPP